VNDETKSIERTAPRYLEDCPSPGDPDPWKHTDGSPPRDFDDPHKAIEWAQMERRYADRLRFSAAVALAGEVGLVEAASAAEITVDELQTLLHEDRWRRQRWEYSKAYYDRHSDRVHGEWYLVEDGDPELPDDNSFSTRDRSETLDQPGR
jgi:hypothetical protein